MLNIQLVEQKEFHLDTMQRPQSLGCRVDNQPVAWSYATFLLTEKEMVCLSLLSGQHRKTMAFS
jgi:hypothetical protein